MRSFTILRRKSVAVNRMANKEGKLISLHVVSSEEGQNWVFERCYLSGICRSVI